MLFIVIVGYFCNSSKDFLFHFAARHFIHKMVCTINGATVKPMASLYC